MCLGVFPIHVCAWHACSANEGQKVMDPLKLKLQMVVSYHVGASQVNPGPLEEYPVLLIAEPSL